MWPFWGFYWIIWCSVKDSPLLTGQNWSASQLCVSSGNCTCTSSLLVLFTFAGHTGVHPKTFLLGSLLPSFLPPQSLASSASKTTILFPQLNETAILCWGSLSALGSSKCLQAGSQVDYRAHVIYLASLWDHIATLPVVQYLQIVISFFSPGFQHAYSRKSRLLPVALSYQEVQACLFPLGLLNYLTALTSCKQSFSQFLKMGPDKGDSLRNLTIVIFV